MGFLNQNTTYLGNDITFPVVEGYCGSIGAAMAAIDGQMNDFALFEAALKYDFSEAMALKEDADIEPLQEASLKGMIDRIIEFLKKLGSKIQALFASIMAKLDSYIKKDSKAFVEKYEKRLPGKSYKGMKAKYSAPKGDGYILDASYHFNLVAANVNLDKDFNRDDFIEEKLGAVVGESKCTAKEFSKKVHEKLYNSETEKDNWDLGDFTTMGARLKNSDKPLAALKKKNDSIQADIKKAIAEIQKSKTAVGDKYKVDGSTDVSDVNIRFGNNYNDDGKSELRTAKGGAAYSHLKSDTASKLQQKLGRLQQEATAHQSAIMTYCSGIMSEAKWGIAQDRRVFAQAVAFHALKEDAILAEAVGDVAEQECLSAFEEMEICA